jgi:hypothetical protein
MRNYFTVVSLGKGGRQLEPHEEKPFLNVFLSVRL